MENENLGPAEKIIETLIRHKDHMIHNRCGLVVPDGRTVAGVRWEPATWRAEDEGKVVYRKTLTPVPGKKKPKVTETRVGLLQEDNTVVDNGEQKGVYRLPGIFPEVAAWMYRQVAEVWAMDNEFAARWASYAYLEDHKDLKVVLAAFMLCQSRKGDPIVEDGKVLFHDDDFRDVGEAMLLTPKAKGGQDHFSPKLVLRVHELLNMPEIAAVNRELGFGRSARQTFVGRWPKTAAKWLRYREDNPKALGGLVKAGYKSTVASIVRRSGFKPDNPKFFEALGWKQHQAKDGRRQVAIGQEITKETWKGMTEGDICQTIEKDKPGWKRIVGLVPEEVGVTRAIMACAVENGCLSKKDLIILTPLLEELGLMKVQEVRERWEQALKEATDMRAANIARNVKSKDVQDKLEEGADNAVKAAVEAEVAEVDLYVFIDRSGSMEGAIEAAKGYIAKFLQAFPLDRVHVASFNTVAREVEIKHASSAGVQNALRGMTASGGTNYGSAVDRLSKYKPAEGHDALFIFIGDELAEDFDAEVRRSGLNPVAFGFILVDSNFSLRFKAQHPGRYAAVTKTAAKLGIPCFQIEESTFEDVYEIPRTFRNLVAATPVGRPVAGQVAPVRVSLIDRILATDVLKKPVWA